MGFGESHAIPSRRYFCHASPDRAQAAWDELYAAEGSDWFWWYGDDFDCGYNDEFDRLFRTHLRNVWTIAGLTPPDQFNQPICRPRGLPEADIITAPLALLNPSLDGLVTDFFEWRGASRIETQPPLGAMWKAEGILTDIQFGWSLDRLYLRLDPDEQSQPRQAELTVELQLQTPEHLYRLSCSLAPAEQHQFLLSQKLSNGSWQEIGPINRSVIERLSSWLCRSRTYSSPLDRKSKWPSWCWSIAWKSHATRTTSLRPSLCQDRNLRQPCGEYKGRER